MSRKKINKTDSGDFLPVMEIFVTLQGEGFHTGQPAAFIRLAGCEIGCNWCDSKASWNARKWPLKDLEEIVNEVYSVNQRSVIVSGGEPLSNNLGPLSNALRRAGMVTFLETAGCYPLTGEWDWITISPKKQTPPLLDILSIADELKVIIASEDDFQWALQNAELVGEDCLLYVQPEWSVRKSITPAIVRFILQNPTWILSLQSHKYIGIP